MPIRYTLGPLDAPTLVLTDTSQRNIHGVGAVDDDGVLWLCEHPTGWDDVDFTAPIDRADGVDGGLVGPQSIGPKTIGITGTFIAPNRAAAAAATRRLRAALPVRGRVPFAVEDEDGLRLWVDAVPSGAFRPVPVAGRGVVFSFALVTTAPHKLAVTPRLATTRLPDPAAQAGVTPPITLGTLVLTTTTATGGSMRVTNLGDAPAWPTATITGPVSDPTARNATTGEYVQWDIDLPVNSAMTVDFRTGLTTIDGIQREVPLLGAGADHWVIPPGPGGIDVEFRSTGIYDNRAQMTFTWADTYR